MKVWKILDSFGDANDLTFRLNMLERVSGNTIKEVIFVEKNHYQIIYTVEDMMEAADAGN